MRLPLDSAAQRTPAEDTPQGWVTHDEMDPRPEDRLRRLVAWAWRFLLIGFVLVLLSPPAQALPGAHAPACAAPFSAR